MSTKQLTYRYAFALSLVALLAAVLLALALVSAHQGDRDTRLINLAGRQRMLSQRIPLLAQDPARNAAAYTAAIELFSDSHERLLIASTNDPDLALIYSVAGDDVDWRSRLFAEQAVQTARSGFDDAEVWRLTSLSEELLPDLDAATMRFEGVAGARTAEYQRLEIFAFLATILILLFEAFFIFRPAVRSISQTLKRLRRARDAADRANAAKTEFLAQMSHEIRTPLNGVLGMASSLRDTPLNRDQSKMVGTIAASGDLLLSVVNDVLDLSKIEADEIELEAIDLSLTQLIDWTVSAYRAACEEKGLSLDIAIEPGLSDWHKGDPTRLKQILSNLVANAIKFTPAGSISLSVRGGPSERAGIDRIEICVADTGIGIPDQKRASIFKPFTQADSSTTRAYGGSGLGLSICYRLAELMDGDIRVDSREGAGSVFTVSLHLERTTAPAEAAPAPEAAEPTRTLTALVVDDVATNRMVLQAMLGRHNVKAILVASGLEAITAINERDDIDVVLMDIQMPDLDGIEATRRIRTLEADHVRDPLPIIAVTANVMTNQIAEYHAAGMNQHLPKPIDPRRLETLITSLQ